MRLLSQFISRYDGQALRPPHSGPDAGAPPADGPELQAWGQLRAWCFSGAGDGARPLLRPGARPAVALRFSVAVFESGDSAWAARLAEAFCLELDGTRLLQSCGGRVAGLRLRLAVKLRDAAWWRHRRAGDPWDSGFALAHAAGQDRLARSFRPRRATLVVAAGLPEPALLACIEALNARQGEFDQPVRLLALAVPRTALAARIAALPGRPEVTVIGLPG